MYKRQSFYEATDDATREKLVLPFIEYRGVKTGQGLESDLYRALVDFPPMGLLVNMTMKEALPIGELGHALFPTALPIQANTALTVLMALGSLARTDPKGAGLLPCRVHNFFRGLPGLWICMDSKCTEMSPSRRSGISGKMYGDVYKRQVCLLSKR